MLRFLNEKLEGGNITSDASSFDDYILRLFYKEPMDTLSYYRAYCILLIGQIFSH